MSVVKMPWVGRSDRFGQVSNPLLVWESNQIWNIYDPIWPGENRLVSAKLGNTIGFANLVWVEHAFFFLKKNIAKWRCILSCWWMMKYFRRFPLPWVRSLMNILFNNLLKKLYLKINIYLKIFSLNPPWLKSMLLNSAE